MKIIIFLVLAGLSLAQDVLNCPEPPTPKGRQQCLLYALNDINGFTDTLYSLLCDYRISANPIAENDQAAARNFIRGLACAGCYAGDFLNAGDTFEKLLYDITRLGTEIRSIVLKIGDALELTKAELDLICNKANPIAENNQAADRNVTRGLACAGCSAGDFLNPGATVEELLIDTPKLEIEIRVILLDVEGTIGLTDTVIDAICKLAGTFAENNQAAARNFIRGLACAGCSAGEFLNAGDTFEKLLHDTTNLETEIRSIVLKIGDALGLTEAELDSICNGDRRTKSSQRVLRILQKEDPVAVQRINNLFCKNKPNKFIGNQIVDILTDFSSIKGVTRGLLKKLYKDLAKYLNLVLRNLLEILRGRSKIEDRLTCNATCDRGFRSYSKERKICIKN